MLGATGRDQVTSIVVLYGPRTTALVACDDGVYEFTCGTGNKWFASRERIQIKKVLITTQIIKRSSPPKHLGCHSSLMQMCRCMFFVGGVDSLKL